jgi:isopentenyl-diphosphate Delta-isomerase
VIEEEFDIVDENNKPLGFTKKRSEVHKDGDWHRVVHIYVVNDKGEFLVHLRSPHKDLHPNKWDTRFGGHVKAGKTLDETVVDELREEIGLTPDMQMLLSGKVKQTPKGSNSEFCAVYFYRYNGPIEKLSFNDNEVVDVRFMSQADILDALIQHPDDWTGSADGFKMVLDEYKQLTAV